MNEIDR